MTKYKLLYKNNMLVYNINISVNTNKAEIMIWDFYSVKQLWVLMWSWRSG
jgi:hypothetical protein